MKTVTVVVAINSDGRGGPDQIARSFVYRGKISEDRAIKRAVKTMVYDLYAEDNGETTRQNAADSVNEWYQFLWSITEMV